MSKIIATQRKFLQFKDEIENSSTKKNDEYRKLGEYRNFKTII